MAEAVRDVLWGSRAVKVQINAAVGVLDFSLKRSVLRLVNLICLQMLDVHTRFRMQP